MRNVLKVGSHLLAIVGVLIALAGCNTLGQVPSEEQKPEVLVPTALLSIADQEGKAKVVGAVFVIESDNPFRDDALITVDGDGKLVPIQAGTGWGDNLMLALGGVIGGALSAPNVNANAMNETFVNVVVGNPPT